MASFDPTPPDTSPAQDAAPESSVVADVRRRSRQRLIGVLILVVLGLAVLTWLFSRGGTPPPAPVQIEDSSGQAVTMDHAGKSAESAPADTATLPAAPVLPPATETPLPGTTAPAAPAETPAPAPAVDAAAAATAAAAAAATEPAKPAVQNDAAARQQAQRAQKLREQKKRDEAARTERARQLREARKAKQAAAAAAAKQRQAEAERARRALQDEPEEAPAAKAVSPKPAAPKSVAPKAPAPKPAAPAKAPDAAVAKPAGNGYVVQVGAYADKASVERARARLGQQGLSSHTQIVKVDGGSRTRVRMGPFATQAQAASAAAKAQALGLGGTVMAAH